MHDLGHWMLYKQQSQSFCTVNLVTTMQRTGSNSPANEELVRKPFINRDTDWPARRDSTDASLILQLITRVFLHMSNTYNDYLTAQHVFPLKTILVISIITSIISIITNIILLARDSMLSALYAIAHPSVRLSVCPSHGWISRKRLNVSSKFFHYLIGPTF